MIQQCPHCGLICYSDHAYRAHVAKCPKKPEQKEQDKPQQKQTQKPEQEKQ